MTLRTCTECGGSFATAIPDGMSAAAWAAVEAMGGVCGPCGDRLDEERDRWEREERMRERVESSGLPMPLQGLSWADMDRTDERASAVDTAARWADGGPSALLLHGPPGTGKTRLAATATWQWMQRGGWISWVSVPHLVAQAQGGFDTDERRRAVLVLTGRRTIVLDDIDKVKPTEWVVTQLYAAVDGRVQAGAGILVTTNLGPSGLRRRLGEALATRLGALDAVELPGAIRR